MISKFYPIISGSKGTTVTVISELHTVILNWTKLSIKINHWENWTTCLLCLLKVLLFSASDWEDSELFWTSSLKRARYINDRCDTWDMRLSMHIVHVTQLAMNIKYNSYDVGSSQMSDASYMHDTLKLTKLCWQKTLRTVCQCSRCQLISGAKEQSVNPIPCMCVHVFSLSQ